MFSEDSIWGLGFNLTLDLSHVCFKGTKTKLFSSINTTDPIVVKVVVES